MNTKNGQKRLFKRYSRCGSDATFFSTYLFKDQWENILEVQMLRYSKIMLGNCCNIWSSFHSSIMSCHQWVIRSMDWPNHSFLTTKLFSPTLPLHALLASPSVSHGQPNFRPCPRSHQHCTLSKFRLSGHRSHPRPNQSKWYSIYDIEVVIFLVFHESEWQV